MGNAPLYRLTSATYSDGTLFGYAYDAVGNVLTKTQTIASTPAVQTYVYDDANRQTSAAGLAQTYDNNGNLLNDGVTAYTWDGANRMTASGSTAYTYNGLNDRVSAGGVTHQLDLNAGLTQVLADGTNTYLYGAGRLGEQQAAGRQYHLADGLGSVRQLSDASGTVSAAKSYEPYGEVLRSAGAASSAYGFTGEQHSGKLVYLRARYYQAETMRFASRDTWVGEENRPRGYNHWGYVYGNVVNWADPSGLDCSGINDLQSRSSCIGKVEAPSTTGYDVTKSPKGISWYPSPSRNFAARIIKGYEGKYSADDYYVGIKGQIVPVGIPHSQYYINKGWHGLCGQVSAAAILSGFGIDVSANDAVQQYMDLVNKGLIKHPIDEGEEPMPNYTTASQVMGYLRLAYGDIVDIPSENVYTSGYGMDWRTKNWVPKLRNLLGQGYVIFAGVHINRDGTVFEGGKNIKHWVVITGVSYESRLMNTREAERSPWNWIKIYNPFSNQAEHYWFEDFKASWNGNGNMMFPVRIKAGT